MAAILHQTGHVEEARRLFQSVVSRSPDRPEPQLSLALLDLEAGHARAAVDRLNQIRRDWPGAFMVQFYLGESYRQLGATAQAREAYTRCLSEAPAQAPIVPAARAALATLR